MTTAAIVLAAVLAVAAVVFVSRPFVLDPGRRKDTPPRPDEAELSRLRLLEERDRALAALKELEFDHRTGKITDADYRELVALLRADAASALRSLDSLADAARSPASGGESTAEARDGETPDSEPAAGPAQGQR